MIRVGMCPGPKDDEWERSGNPFLTFLSRAAAGAGIEMVPLTPGDLLAPGRAVSEKRLDALHLHWIASVYDLGAMDHYPVPPAAHAAIRRTPLVRRFYKASLPYIRRFPNLLARTGTVAKFKRGVDLWIRGLRTCGVPLVWELHDLLSHNNKGGGDFRALVDAYMHERLYEACDRVIIHEDSSFEAVQAYYGMKKPYAVMPIGPLSDQPGVDKGVARQRLGLPADGTVFAYIGTARPNRNPRKAVESFLRLGSGDSLIVVASKGSSAYLRGMPRNARVVSMDRFLSAMDMRDVYCAADFVINDAEEYLTSGVVRSAMSYAIPVIARAYGSTADMARGAMVEIGPEGLTAAMRRAEGMNPGERSALSAAALARDRERSWKAAGAALGKLYSELLADARG